MERRGAAGWPTSLLVLLWGILCIKAVKAEQQPQLLRFSSCFFHSKDYCQQTERVFLLVQQVLRLCSRFLSVSRLRKWECCWYSTGEKNVMKRRLAGERPNCIQKPNPSGRGSGCWGSIFISKDDQAFNSVILGFGCFDPLYFPYCNENIVWKCRILYF